jgi:DNA-nicking Smr family endonuclease
VPPLPDAALWAEATRDVKPLRRRSASQPPAKVLPAEAKPEPKPAPRTRTPRPAAKPTPRPAKPPPPLDAAAPAGLDRRSAERLRRGQVPIEAKLDLHGMTQDRAHAALERFLAGAVASGLRCVLLVTGKGRTQQEGGVLKRQVPRWLNEPAFRPHVLAIATARPGHGGEGALYLLLRRRREI